MNRPTLCFYIVSLLVTLVAAQPGWAECKLTETELQGEPAIVLENDLVQLRLRPTLGGRIDQFVYKPTDTRLTAPIDGRVFVDRVWNYANRDIYRQWTSAVYEYKLQPGQDTAAVTLNCRGSTGIGTRMTFEKTISLTSGSAAVRADYSLAIGHEAMKPQRAGIWWHNQLGVPQETTTYYVPTAQGVKSLAYGAGASGQYWWYDVVRGWGAALGESGTGVAAIMDCRKLMCFYQYMSGDVGLMEWAFRSEEIPNGGSTTTTIWLVPFAGLDSVAGAGAQVVGEINAPDKLTVEQARAGVPVTVKLTAPQSWTAAMKMTWQRLPDGKVNELPAWAAELGPQNVAEKQFNLQLPDQGTYVLRAEALDGDGLAADFFAELTVGEASGEVAIAPLQERLGREGERFEDNIVARGTGSEYVPPSEEIVTPHVKWAKPYVRGPLKALILNDLLTGRETIELAQRLDMDYVAPTLSSSYSMRGGAEAPVWGIVRERLPDEWDVILISGISGAVFPDDIVETILDKVRAGTGLIMVNPNNCSDALWDVLAFAKPEPASRPPHQWRSVADHYLTLGIPWDELPPADTCYYKATGDVLAKADKLPLLVTRELGKGRIICLAYATSWQGSGFYANGLTPWIQFAPTKFAYWEYYFSLLAKCMTWAAHKEPPVQFTSLALDQETYLARTGDQPTLKLAITNSAQAADLVARVTINDEYGHTVRWFDKAFMAPPGESELDILLPELYGGLHLADIIVSNEAGARVDWATVPVHVQAPVEIAELTVADEIYRRGQTVTAQMTLAATENAPAQVRLVASLTDAYDRLIWRHEQPVASEGDCEVAFSLPEPLATTAVLRLELHDDAGLLDAAEQKILTMPPAWDTREWTAFRSGLWGSPAGAYSREYLQQVKADLVKNVGIDAVTTSGNWLLDGEQRTAFETGLQSMVMGVAAGVLSTGGARSKDHLTFAKQKDEYVRTHDKKYLQRAWCLNADDTREHVSAKLEKVAAAVAKYRPIGYVCGDELSVTYYTTPFDYDFTPGCLDKFRLWLQTQYATLSALNDEWDTDFATWDEVLPMTADEVGDRTNYAPWADHRTFMEITFADFLRWTDDTLESHDPGARLGTSGSQAASAYGGYDWWRLTDAFDFIQAYDHQNTGEMHRSFHDMLAAPWWGYGATDPALEHQLWRRLLNDNAGGMYFSCASLIKPDYTYTQTAAEGREHVKEMRGGLARLLHACDGRAVDVYMHYSHPSIHAAFITGGEPTFKNNQAGWLKAIEDSALQMKFLSYAQIEDGQLTNLMPTAFILPYSVAISDQEAQQMREYVEAGGTLIADARTGLMDQHCAPRAAGALDELFGIERTDMNPKARRIDGEAVFTTALGECDPTPITFQDLSGDTTIEVTTGTALGKMADTPLLIVRNVGKGKAVLLNLFMDSYARRRNLAVHQPLQELLGEVLDLAGVKPFTRIAAADADRYYVVRYYGGDAHYVGILRETGVVLTGGGPGSAATGEAPHRRSHIAVTFPRQAHVYDLRAGEYLGKTDRAEKLMPQGYCQIYSLLPYQVTAVSVILRAKAKQPGERVSYRVRVETDGAQPGRHVFRVQVTGPDGLRDYYGTQITADDGSGEAEFDLALNDASGTWRIEATDVATGVSGTAELTVTAP